MRKMLLAAAALLGCGAIASDADARVVVRVSKSRQTMYVYVDGYLDTSGRSPPRAGGYSTPSGAYRPTGFDPYHRSRPVSQLAHAASSITLFHGGYAIHGSYDINHLGSPASHGCIRLHPEDAAELYGLCAIGRHTHYRFALNSRRSATCLSCRGQLPRRQRELSHGNRQGDFYGYDTRGWAAFGPVIIAVVAIIVIIVVVAGWIRIANEYERGVVFRLGRLVGTRGPGLYSSFR